jgi:hypothetical protein
MRSPAARSAIAVDRQAASLQPGAAPSRASAANCTGVGARPPLSHCAAREARQPSPPVAPMALGIRLSCVPPRAMGGERRNDDHFRSLRAWRDRGGSPHSPRTREFAANMKLWHLLICSGPRTGERGRRDDIERVREGNSNTRRRL